MTATRLAVLGSPIRHSLSPALHSAAYDVLGLDWSYGVAEVGTGGLPGFLEGLDGDWRGLSLTMPLKQEVLPLLDTRSDLVGLTGAANTVRLDGGTVRGWNTDVAGITEAFRHHDVRSLLTVDVLGAGATALSAVAAAGVLGARDIEIAVRNPARAADAVAMGERLGIAMRLRGLDEAPTRTPDAVVSTLPNGVETALRYTPDQQRDAVLFDVAYHPGPPREPRSGSTRAVG
ncbi:shikimate dehydrogenase family protein [Arenivirga flava]|uniref:Shikimate 5-dehydrogenase n=1 Tax=Arenivirga flava TaxID=1930060 RepID=A0AA37UGJ9_9MICO|nr:shikimate dehydrogenase [Arenivirga flava]GMA27611.1 shikimate 5-dehydrogenase [Arenivirga flava]